MARPVSPGLGVIFDLGAIDQAMRSEEAYAREGHTARTLVREHELRVVLIVMKAGTTSPNAWTDRCSLGACFPARSGQVPRHR